MAEIRNDVYPAAIVKIIDEFTIVINRGFIDGVKKGTNFLVYYVEPDEIFDPETGESLGKLEIVKGTGTVIHVQERLATVHSNRTENRGRIVRKSGSATWASILGETIEEGIKDPLPFDKPQIGDKVKPT